jgi:hypothetical protein
VHGGRARHFGCFVVGRAPAALARGRLGRHRVPQAVDITAFGTGSWRVSCLSELLLQALADKTGRAMALLPRGRPLRRRRPADRLTSRNPSGSTRHSRHPPHSGIANTEPPMNLRGQPLRPSGARPSRTSTSASASRPNPGPRNQSPDGHQIPPAAAGPTTSGSPRRVTTTRPPDSPEHRSILNMRAPSCIAARQGRSAGPPLRGPRLLPPAPSRTGSPPGPVPAVSARRHP